VILILHGLWPLQLEVIVKVQRSTILTVLFDSKDCSITVCHPEFLSLKLELLLEDEMFIAYTNLARILYFLA
jgi:hypothetical protein